MNLIRVLEIITKKRNDAEDILDLDSRDAFNISNEAVKTIKQLRLDGRIDPLCLLPGETKD